MNWERFYLTFFYFLNISQNPYPEKKEFIIMSEKYGLTTKKIENWYKYYQRKLALEKNQLTPKIVNKT